MNNIKKNRHTLLFLFILLHSGFFIFSSFTMDSEIQEVIKAKKFELVDETGKIIIQIRPGRSKGIQRAGVIESMNVHGNQVWYIGYDGEDNAGSINLYDSDGSILLNMGKGTKAWKGGYIDVFDENGVFENSLAGMKK